MNQCENCRLCLGCILVSYIEKTKKPCPKFILDNKTWCKK